MAQCFNVAAASNGKTKVILVSTDHPTERKKMAEWDRISFAVILQ